MPNVTVYKVQLYNAITDAPLISRRMATRKGAAMMGGVVIEDSATEIDSTLLERREEWTERGFRPSAINPVGKSAAR